MVYVQSNRPPILGFLIIINFFVVVVIYRCSKMYILVLVSNVLTENRLTKILVINFKLTGI